MIERGLGHQWRHLQRFPLMRQHFPFRRRKHYYFDHGRRGKPFRNQLMIAQSEDFIDRNTEFNTNNLYFNQQRVPYYSGRYSPRHYRQNIPERKRRFHHSFWRQDSRPRYYEHHHQDDRHHSQDSWQEDYQLRDYFYYG